VHRKGQVKGKKKGKIDECEVGEDVRQLNIVTEKEPCVCQWERERNTPFRTALTKLSENKRRLLTRLGTLIKGAIVKKWERRELWPLLFGGGVGGVGVGGGGCRGHSAMDKGTGGISTKEKRGCSCVSL